MASIGDTTRPAFAYDEATDTWVPVGVGPHSHTPAAIGAIASSIVTTKGDIIAATGSGLVVRQGVGADGSYLMADSSQADGLSYASGNNLAAGKNGTINGGFDIWQRGTSVSIPASSAPYSADRWCALAQAGQASTISRQLTNDTTNLPNIEYCARVQRNSGQTGTADGLGIFNNFESLNSQQFAGKQVTYSFYARAGANFSASSSTMKARLYTGTGTDQNIIFGYSGLDFPIDASPVLTTTWQRFSYTTTLSVLTNELCLGLYYVPTGTAGANDYFEVTGVQLELGSVATPFARNASTIQGELAACQRYFFKIGGEIANQMTLRQGGYFDANYISFYCPYPVPMRTAPSITAYGNPQVYQSGTAYSGFTWNNTIGGNPSTQNQYIVATKTSHGLTVNLSMVLDCVTTSDYIGVSAEL